MILYGILFKEGFAMELIHLIELDRLAKLEGQKYSKKRYLLNQLDLTAGKHFTGIVGPRGSGKTIILKQIALSTNNSFYLSLDTFKDDLFTVIQSIHRELGIENFLLDEVHVHSDFDEVLKKVYDFLKIKIVFTSSMALSMYASSYDLSRRVILKTLYPFSFREFLDFKHNITFPEVQLDQIIDGSWNTKLLQAADFFNDFLRGGNLPFALEEPSPLPLLSNIVQTVIQKDITKVARLTLDELESIDKLLAFIGRSSVDGINYSTISGNLKITKYKSEQYVSLLERAFILHRIFPKGTNLMKEPKIVMALPYRLLYRSFEDSLGGLREDFFIEMVRSLGLDLSYLKSTRGTKTPDYVLKSKNNIVLEIGGKTKGRTQFKGIQIDKKIILSHSIEVRGIKRPLFLIGML